ncbi:fumarylacetoacetate hydrolase family protein [Alteribacillus iranensis]|uniref:5-carboxy-2-oxohept-3-enedioate decarboxylase HpaG1 subunit n=1 Tax=Alteribacillus iranensis TaxID=930128 RepID=A0A1I2DQ75_9BACI|nr:fumarylacetoacetate hydrolase family protein [Alteribacillus iranensis]SFE82599.1 5-carboxy-2-oxohept-3-enedioate decarboxylase HpaG1 subunit [Alteribacillus iranensis]
MAKARSLFNDLYQSTTVEVETATNQVTHKNNTHQANDLHWRVPVSGTVYGTALNYKGQLEQMGDSLNEDPYKAPPKAPVLYIKPINTFTPHQASIPLPDGEQELQIGAALGVVFKKTTTQVEADSALDYIEGFTIVNDVSIPHESVHRPAIKQKARDGFCPIGPWVIQAEDISNPDDLRIEIMVNGEVKLTNSTKNLVRNVKELIADVSEFMTFYKDDVLLVGTPENAPIVREGDTVAIQIEGIGTLENKVEAE